MSSTWRCGALLACLVLVPVAGAQAAEPGWYVLGFGGQASASGASQADIDDNLNDIIESGGLEVTALTSDLDDSDTAFGIAGGYQVNEHFAIEIAWVDIGEVTYDATATVTDGTNTADADVTLASAGDGAVLSVLAMLPIGERFSIFARAGISFLNVDGTARIALAGQTTRLGQSNQSSDPVFGVGAEIGLTRNVALRLGWDRYTDAGTDDVTGDVDVDVYSLGIRLGLAWFR